MVVIDNSVKLCETVTTGNLGPAMVHYDLLQYKST
jgi:hypothetical protein